MKKNLILVAVLFGFINNCFGYDVIYNTKTNKFHDTNCHLTRNCTNCTRIDIDDAIENKAEPCEVCRTATENYDDEKNYKKKKLEEQKRYEATSKGVKKYGNFTYTIK